MMTRRILDTVITVTTIGGLAIYADVWVAGIALAFGAWNYWDGLTRRYL